MFVLPSYVWRAPFQHISLMLSPLCSSHSFEQTRRLRYHDKSAVNAMMLLGSSTILQVPLISRVSKIESWGLHVVRDIPGFGPDGCGTHTHNKINICIILEVVGNQGHTRSRTRGAHFGANATQLAQ